MKAQRLKHGLLLGVLALSFGTTALAPTASANFENGLRNSEQCSDDDAKNAGKAAEVPTGSGGGRDFTKKGTLANKNATTMWNYWKDKGYGGGSIAGILGNIAIEGGFTMPDRPQGYYGDDPNMGIAHGHGGSGGADGGGFYQFTPISKFRPNGDKDWLDIKKQSDFVWNSEVSALTKAGKLGRAKSPEQGAEDWSGYYERPGSYDNSKTAEAVKAYNFFDGDSVKPNDGSLISAGNTASDNNNLDKTAADKNAAENDCPTGDSQADAADGTGSHKEPAGTAWKNFSDLPADVKQYAHDPAKLLGSRGSGAKWIALGVGPVSYGQCVGFSVAYGDALFGLKGNRMGNGIDTAGSFARDLNIKTSKTPKAGAIFSQTSPITSAGHTGVIAHVYANGDMLLVEQNFGGKSGDANGEKFTWDFRIASKSSMEKLNSEYVFPGDNKKHKLIWEK